VLDTNADRIKLIVEIIEIAEKVSKYLPIVVFSYAGLTLVFAVINLLEHNIASGIILCVFAAFGIYLALRILLTRRKTAFAQTQIRDE
jgi:Flp pilus assembly protein TadB